MDANIKCGSLPDKLEIYSDFSGLSLIKKDKKNTPVRFIFLSKWASSASLHEICVPPKYISLLSISEVVMDKNLKSYIVLCNSGEIFLVLPKIKSGRNCMKIGEIQGNIIWADIVKDCVLLFESSGKLHVGSLTDSVIRNGFQEEKDVFNWRFNSLSITPICCCALEDHLIISDGFSSYLYHFDNSKSEKLQRLPYAGIITIKKSLAKVVLYVSDGRQYSKLLSTLKEDAHVFSEKNTDDTLSVENISLSSVMKSIKRFSEYAAKEKTQLNKLNLYLEQLSYIYLFLMEVPKNLFSVKLIGTFSELEEEYILFIYLKPDSSQFTLKGDWWQLNVKLKGCGNVKYLYSDLVNENNFGTFGSLKFKVPLIFVEELMNDLTKETYLEFELMFSEYFHKKPLCTFRVHSEPVDTLCFLISTCSTIAEPLETFESKVRKIFKSFSTKQEKPIIPIHQKETILFRQKWLPVLENLFPELSLKDGKSSETCSKWLRNDRIKLSLEKTGSNNLFKLTVEGTVRSLIISVKFCVEKRIFMHQALNNNEDKQRVRLKVDHYKELLANKTALNLETSTESVSEIALKRIRDSLDSLISSLWL